MSSRPASSRPPIYGLIAEFSDPNELIAAIRQSRAGGYPSRKSFWLTARAKMNC